MLLASGVAVPTLYLEDNIEPYILFFFFIYSKFQSHYFVLLNSFQVSVSLL
jgi:hypothetical protein